MKINKNNIHFGCFLIEQAPNSPKESNAKNRTLFINKINQEKKMKTESLEVGSQRDVAHTFKQEKSMH